MVVVGLRVGLRKPGLWVLGQKPKTGPLGLGFKCAVGNGSGGRWGEVVGWCRQGCGGGVYVNLSTHKGGGGQGQENPKTKHGRLVSGVPWQTAVQGNGGMCCCAVEMVGVMVGVHI